MTRLALVIEAHGQALEYDLMTRTGRTLAEYMAQGADGMLALCAFLRYVPPDSALYRATHPKDEVPDWATQIKTNAILADLYDAFVAVHTKKGRQARKYPRPGDRKGRSIGKGAIPIRDFEAWWNAA